jgi:hypothetical protein
MGAVALRAYGHHAGWVATAWRPLLATAAFALALWLGRGLPLLASSTLASAVFVAATFAFGVWDARERAILAGWRRKVGG